MKATLYITITTIAIMAIVSCIKSTPPVTTEVGLLVDITSIQTIKPDTNEILSVFDLKGDKRWNGATFHYSEISDVSYNQISETKINTADIWSSNEIGRDKEIKNFKTTVLKILDNTEHNKTGKNNSAIYLPIARELNRLANSKAQKRILLIYSDLMENTIDITFYNKKQFQNLTTNPEAIQKQFEQLQVIQNLHGIEVHLIYQPIDSQSDKVFRIVSGFYKKLLENKGAKVKISASVNL